MAEGRTPEAIREEIRAEREKLDASVAALQAGAARTGKQAGSAVAAAGGVLWLAKRLRRRRKS